MKPGESAPVFVFDFRLALGLGLELGFLFEGVGGSLKEMVRARLRLLVWGVATAVSVSDMKDLVLRAMVNGGEEEY